MSLLISSSRSLNYFKQLQSTVLFKTIAIVASFSATPFMIDYLGPQGFGVWSTILSILTWIAIFDLGIGNGLKNKIAECIAKSINSEISIYISTSYLSLTLLSTSAFLIFLPISFYINWQSIFNTNHFTQQELRITVTLCVAFMLLNFCLNLLSSILGAIQKLSIMAFILLISNILILTTSYILNEFMQSSLLYLAIGVGASLTIPILIGSLIFFKNNVTFSPKIIFKKSHFKPLITLGGQFFIIQIAGLLIFSIDKLLITQLLGPDQVTQYDVVYKLFSILLLGHATITAPLWSAYTDAFYREDLFWIQSMLKKQLALLGLFALGIIIITILNREIFSFWIGDKVKIDYSLVISMGIFVFVSIWNSIFGVILGGIGKIRLGSIYTLFAAGLNIPLCYILSIKFDFGVTGVVIGATACIIISSFISPIQVYYFIFSKNKTPLLTKVLS